MSNTPLITSSPPKVFIPMLTDVVAFPDGVPVLTENADDIHNNHDGLNTPATPAVEPAVEHPAPAVAVDVDALSRQMWTQLEPALQTMLREAVLAVLAQQQTALMEQLGASLRPMLAQTLATILQSVEPLGPHRQTEGDGERPHPPPEA